MIDLKIIGATDKQYSAIEILSKKLNIKLSDTGIAVTVKKGEVLFIGRKGFKFVISAEPEICASKTRKQRA